MAVSFNDLVSPLNQAAWVQYLLTALQGVGPIIQSPAQNTNQLFGTGSLSIQGPAASDATVVIRIAQSGNADTSNPATFQYSVDGGVTFQPSSPISMASLSPSFSFPVPGANVSVTFENGSYTTAGSGGFYFVGGEAYTFFTFTPTFPVTNWPAIGVANSLVQTDAQALSDLNILQAQATAGGYTQSWINPPLVNGVPTPPPDGWADLLANNFYNRQRGEALQTEGFALLTAAGTAGPYTILPGQVFASSANGQYVFTNTTGGTLARGGVLTLTMRAMGAGSAYNQVESIGIGGSGFWLTALIAPTLAGVAITNPLQDTPEVFFSGTGAGSVTITSGVGGPANEYNAVIKIIQGGAVGTATFKYSLDSGATYTAPITTAATVSLGATNLTAAFSGTFSTGDLYAFSTSWITQRGVDAESSMQLMIDCQAQWPTLADESAKPDGQYLLWAKAASPEVVDALIVVDQINPGQVDITLIGQAPNGGIGPVSAAAIAAVTTYIQVRVGLTISVQVSTVAQLPVLVTAAYIVCKSQYRNVVQNTIQQLLNAYGNTLLPTATVELSEVAAIIQGAQGVVEINPLSSLQLNGAAADIVLADNQVVKFTTPPLSSFRFV